MNIYTWSRISPLSSKIIFQYSTPSQDTLKNEENLFRFRYLIFCSSMYMLYKAILDFDLAMVTSLGDQSNVVGEAH